MNTRTHTHTCPHPHASPGKHTIPVRTQRFHTERDTRKGQPTHHPAAHTHPPARAGSTSNTNRHPRKNRASGAGVVVAARTPTPQNNGCCYQHSHCVPVQATMTRTHPSQKQRVVRRNDGGTLELNSKGLGGPVTAEGAGHRVHSDGHGMGDGVAGAAWPRVPSPRNRTRCTPHPTCTGLVPGAPWTAETAKCAPCWPPLVAKGWGQWPRPPPQRRRAPTARTCSLPNSCTLAQAANRGGTGSTLFWASAR